MPESLSSWHSGYCYHRPAKTPPSLLHAREKGPQASREVLHEAYDVKQV